MTYAMTLDNSWEIINEDEMYDVNGGGTRTNTMSASSAVTYLGILMADWFAQAGLSGYLALALAAPTAGLGTFLAGIWGGYATHVALKYMSAYSQASTIVDDFGGSTMVDVKTTTFLWIGITNVTCTVA